jgi:lysozyme family protein
MDFISCFKIVLGHEGGFVDDPDDPGGATKYGISQRAYPTIDIHELSEREAMQIYESDYWDKIKADYLPAKLRLILFDCAVNQGVARACMFLQRSCGVSADGIVGPQTIKIASELPVEFLIDSISRQRMQAYVRNPRWDSFGKGWAVRLFDITLRSLAPDARRLT